MCHVPTSQDIILPTDGLCQRTHCGNISNCTYRIKCSVDACAENIYRKITPFGPLVSTLLPPNGLELKCHSTFCPMRVSSTPKMSVLLSARFFRLACTCGGDMKKKSGERERERKEGEEEGGKGEGRGGGWKRRETRGKEK